MNTPSSFPYFNGSKPLLFRLLLIPNLFIILLMLYFGKTIFIPLSFALLLSLLLYPICQWLETHHFSKGWAIAFSLILVFVFLMLLIFLFIAQIIQFSHEWQQLETNMEETFQQLSVFLSNQFGFTADKQLLYLKNSINQSGSQAFAFIRSTLSSLTESLYYLLLVSLFSVLLLYYRHLMMLSLCSLFSKDKQTTIIGIVHDFIHEFYQFAKGMIMVYAIVGVLNSLGLALLGIPYPILFGFTASLLTFIPYIGLMISSLLPITIAWITYNSIWYPLGVVIVFAIVQVLEANVIFPYIVGNRMKINALAILVVILLGGILWGASGMILFVPFLSILKLIAEKVPSLQFLSYLLGDGKMEMKGS